MFKSKPLLTTLTLLFIVANELGSWPVLRLWNLYANKGFIDLQSPLHHIECFSQGAEMEVLRQEVVHVVDIGMDLHSYTLEKFSN